MSAPSGCERKDDNVSISALAGSFSMPIGGAQLYPPPPYLYRGVEDMFVSFEADREAVASLLPPLVTAADDPPLCFAWARWVPFSTFGPYHEAYIMIRARFNGGTYLYQPFIFTDAEPALAAGREIWGYAKKLAVMERSWGGAGSPFGEQLVFTVERPKGKRIMTVSLACDSLGNPDELPKDPALSVRLIPNCEAGKPPSIAELVCLRARGARHLSADGTAKLWEGRGSVTMDSPSEVDPWYKVAPTKIIKGWFTIRDFDLPHGESMHNYLEDDIDWA